MGKNKLLFLFTLGNGVIFLLSLITDWYTELVLIQTTALVFLFLLKLGNGIVLRELIALHGALLCLVMPLVGYTWYGPEYSLARAFFYYMFVPYQDYFSYALPAMSGFIFMLCWPINNKKVGDEGKVVNGYLFRAKQIFRQNPKVGITILITGLLGSLLGEFLPDSLGFVFVLLYFSSYAGIIYIYFNKSLPYRKWLIGLFILFVFGKALGGMFTEVAYMGVTVFSFIFLGKKISMFKKLSIFFAAVLFFVVLQSVKMTYRIAIWDQGYSDNKVELFTGLFWKRMNNLSELADRKSFMPIYSRFNQGLNISRVMVYIPSRRNFDGGDKLSLSLAAAIVPRFLWVDKPKSGGHENMLYYTGWKVRGWSTNIGPLGEAYGSFGRAGGILFLLLLGIFIRWVYKLIFKLNDAAPLLIFWIPVLFYQVTSFMETDTLTLLNAVVKGGVYIYLLYKIVPNWFGNGVREGKANRFSKKPLMAP